jgi:hypothetical protein
MSRLAYYNAIESTTAKALIGSAKDQFEHSCDATPLSEAEEAKVKNACIKHKTIN